MEADFECLTPISVPLLSEHHDRVKTLVYMCMVGNGATDILKSVGIVAGKKMTEKMIEDISFDMIKAINKKVGYRFITKFGKTGTVNLGKYIPLVGGVIGGTFDGVTTKTIGSVAKRVFLNPQDVVAEEVLVV